MNIKNENDISIRSVSGRGGQCDIQYTTYRQTDRHWRNLYKIIHLLIAQALSTPAVWSRRGKLGGY